MRVEREGAQKESACGERKTNRQPDRQKGREWERASNAFKNLKLKCVRGKKITRDREREKRYYEVRLDGVGCEFRINLVSFPVNTTIPMALCQLRTC